MVSRDQASVEEGQQQEWKSAERMYALDKHTFTKRELKPHEQHIGLDDERVKPFEDSRSRLQNEFYILQYIRQHTDIPVPELISYVEEDGIAILKTERITDGSVTMDDCVETDGAPVVEAVERQLTENIIPALQKHRSRRLGGLNTTEQLILPWLVKTNYEFRSTWRRIPEAEEPDFVLCHNDLGQHNIFIDPKTYAITCIIDWEYSGWYPAEWELPLWRYRPGRQDLRALGKSRAADVFDKLYESTAAEDPAAPKRLEEEYEDEGELEMEDEVQDEIAEEQATELDQPLTPLGGAPVTKAMETTDAEDRPGATASPSPSTAPETLPSESNALPQLVEENTNTETVIPRDGSEEVAAVKQQLVLAEEVVNILNQQLVLAQKSVSALKQRLILIEQRDKEFQT
ncbi:hypothetical protein LTR27_005352 [Elasticomyces elasticus]|nr:hypothetical protein LTR27_005352 [Elasticomyces elasticus]